jgi:hypothetical protein
MVDAAGEYADTTGRTQGTDDMVFHGIAFQA